ncbi:hypothetical protein BS78_05G087900 [Paspalum vaginatum]|nr:hypothetical protein BS78_05G087900 [Paspalum vaginatum]
MVAPPLAHLPTFFSTKKFAVLPSSLHRLPRPTPPLSLPPSSSAPPTDVAPPQSHHPPPSKLIPHDQRSSRPSPLAPALPTRARCRLRGSSDSSHPPLPGDPPPRSVDTTNSSSTLRCLRAPRGLALPPAHVAPTEEGPLLPAPLGSAALRCTRDLLTTRSSSQRGAGTRCRADEVRKRRRRGDSQRGDGRRKQSAVVATHSPTPSSSAASSRPPLLLPHALILHRDDTPGAPVYAAATPAPPSAPRTPHPTTARSPHQPLRRVLTLPAMLAAPAAGRPHPLTLSLQSTPRFGFRDVILVLVPSHVRIQAMNQEAWASRSMIKR